MERGYWERQVARPSNPGTIMAMIEGPAPAAAEEPTPLRCTDVTISDAIAGEPQPGFPRYVAYAPRSMPMLSDGAHLQSADTIKIVRQ